jgi:hypothetical protein
MINPINTLRDSLVPHTTDRWRKGGGVVDEQSGIPAFDDLALEGDREFLGSGRIIDRHGDDIGEHQTFGYRFNQGDYHEARIERIDSAYRSPVPLLRHSDLAFLTLIDGFNEFASAQDGRVTGLDGIIVGSNHGTSDPDYLRDLTKIPSTFKNSPRTSLARSAFKSQLITDDLQTTFTLPRAIVKRGKSQGSIMTPAHYAYAPSVGNSIVYSDTDATCIPEKLFDSPFDVPRLGVWGAIELLSVAGLALSAAKKKEVERYKGTVSLDLNFMVSNVFGNMPALMSGEFGDTVDWVPEDSPMYFNIFNLDLLSRAKVIRQQFANHPNVVVRSPKQILTHNSGITNEDVMEAGSRRVNAFQDLFLAKPNPEMRTIEDYALIYDMEAGTDYPIPRDHAA